MRYIQDTLAARLNNNRWISSKSYQSPFPVTLKKFFKQIAWSSILSYQLRRLKIVEPSATSFDAEI